MSKHASKDFHFEIKSVNEEGQFTGILSVYNVVDLGGDLVEPGAFTKTLQETGGRVPCMYRHEEPIGMLEVSDTGAGLEVKGQLVMDTLADGSPKVPEALKAHALMSAGIVKGMSIGYRTVKAQIEKGIRHLKELALMEGSVVVFPMCPPAQITSVKEEKGDFVEEFERAQAFSMRSMMISALWAALDSIAWDSDMTDVEILANSEQTIDQFKLAYIDFLPRLFAAWAAKSIPLEHKEGRTISAATRTKLEECIATLQALLEPGAASAAPPEGKGVDTHDPGAATQHPVEPAKDHSVVEYVKSLLIGGQ
jgi:HK97 family phage prohead protease